MVLLLTQNLSAASDPSRTLPMVGLLSSKGDTHAILSVLSNLESPNAI